MTLSEISVFAKQSEKRKTISFISLAAINECKDFSF